MKIFTSILLITLLVLIQGCASTAKKAKTVYYPALPETPKIQFLTTISNENDIGNSNNFNEFLLGKKEKQPMSPKLPARLPAASSAPMACAASSTTFKPCRSAMPKMAVISAT